MSISWNQRSRCPNCGGFAGAYKDSKRCRGFKHRDGEGYFCEEPDCISDSVPNARSVAYNFSGYELYYHKYNDDSDT